jgi:hypothetical protein
LTPPVDVTGELNPIIEVSGKPYKKLDMSRDYSEGDVIENEETGN